MILQKTYLIHSILCMNFLKRFRRMDFQLRGRNPSSFIKNILILLFLIDLIQHECTKMEAENSVAMVWSFTQIILI